MNPYDNSRKRTSSMEILLELTMAQMPDSPTKRNGQIVQMYGKIMDQVELIAEKASRPPKYNYNAEDSQKVLEYLNGAYASLQQFIRQMGLEDADGTP